MIIDDSRWQSMIVDDSRYQSMPIKKHEFFGHRLESSRIESISDINRLIVFDCHRLLSMIDFIDWAGIVTKTTRHGHYE